MYKCESCSYIVTPNEEHLGLCPKCSRDSLKEIVVSCPICSKELHASAVDIKRTGWVCSHPTFDIKICLEER